jgi:hypothetical protein
MPRAAAKSMQAVSHKLLMLLLMLLLSMLAQVGLGGLGHMAVKFGVAFGCEVYVISRWN